MGKKKWILLLLTLLLAAAAVIFSFWDALAIYIFPKSVLKKALAEVTSELQTRYSQSPVSMFIKYMNSDGLYTAGMELDTQNQLLGAISYNMTLNADTAENRILGQGIVATAESDLDLSVYLDRDFAALSSEDLLSGTYYGITYDTFPKDIRGIPLISLFIGESVLSEWDTSVRNLQQVMNASYRLPEMPEISPKDMQQAMMAVMLLPSRVERVEMPVFGVYTDGYRISYSAKGEQVGQVLGYLMDTNDYENAQVNASFYVYNNQLVMMQIQGKSGENQIHCALEMMLEENSHTLRLLINDQGEETGMCLRHTAENQNGYLHENWMIFSDFEGRKEPREISYRWEPVMGELMLSPQNPVVLNIFEKNQILHIQTDHFERLLDLIAGNGSSAKKEAINCSITLQNGIPITVPEYKNIHEWTLEDLLVLLGGVGSLFGLKVN